MRPAWLRVVGRHRPRQAPAASLPAAWKMLLGFFQRTTRDANHAVSFPRLDPGRGARSGQPSNPADAAPAASRAWIKSPAWDLVWILNALWLAPLVLLLARGHDDLRTSPVDWLFFALAVPLWFGHRVASAWLAVRDPSVPPLARHAALALRGGPIGHPRRVLRAAAGSRERAAHAARRACALVRCPELPAGELSLCRPALRPAQPVSCARGPSVGTR